jgi:LPS-assembly lipoprotein
MIFSLLLLAACGFQPLYGDGNGDGSGARPGEELARVQILPLPERTGQILHNELRNEINPAGQPLAPTYKLAVRLLGVAKDTGIREDATATRTVLRVKAEFSLRRADTRQVLFTGQSFAIVGYNRVESQFATYTAENDARARAMRQLAQDISAQLAGYFDRARQTAGTS